MNDERLEKLSTHIIERSKNRGLHVDVNKLRYSLDWQLSSLPSHIGKSVLFVGVGHGHDALIGLLQGKFKHVVGVDPYIETDGNGEEDFLALQSILSELNLKSNFSIYPSKIQDFLVDKEKSFDLIVCNDVLHHIFVDKARLSDSKYFEKAVELFRQLRSVISNDGIMIVKEAQRFGLRPFLYRSGLLQGEVDYSTKQSWPEWANAATQGGWHMDSLNNYVPYAFRNFSRLFGGFIGRYTICDLYQLNFSAGDKEL